MKKVKEMKGKERQHGVVLIVALIFLVALTAVAAALMQNSTTDMKMSGASEQKVIATQDALSAIDEVIITQRNDGFIRPVLGNNFPINNPLPVGTGSIATADVVVANNNFLLEPDCPHSKLASSTEVFTCNILRVRVNRNYGRNSNSNIQVSSGITQQLLK